MSIAIPVCIGYLWLYGRFWRSTHYDVAPQVDVRQTQLVDRPDVVFVSIDGAFNSIRHHGQRISSELLKVGDVIELEYNTQRFNRQLARTALFSCLSAQIHTQQYRRVVILGGSSGAKLALWLARRIHYYYGDRIEISIIGEDPILSSRPLSPVQQCALRCASKLRFGPVSNFLLGWTKWYAFRGVPKSRWEPYVDDQAIKRHVAAMRAFSLAAIIDMLSELQLEQEYDPADYSFVRHVVQLRSREDEILVGMNAAREWEHVFAESETIWVPDGGHLTYLEHPLSWSDAHYRALCLFRLLPAKK